MEWCFAGFGGDPFHIMINSGKELAMGVESAVSKTAFPPL
jgi:hypothetical protein